MTTPANDLDEATECVNSALTGPHGDDIDALADALLAVIRHLRVVPNSTISATPPPEPESPKCSVCKAVWPKYGSKCGSKCGKCGAIGEPYIPDPKPVSSGAGERPGERPSDEQLRDWEADGYAEAKAAGQEDKVLSFGRRWLYDTGRADGFHAGRLRERRSNQPAGALTEEPRGYDAVTIMAAAEICKATAKEILDDDAELTEATHKTVCALQRAQFEIEKLSARAGSEVGEGEKS